MRKIICVTSGLVPLLLDQEVLFGYFDKHRPDPAVNNFQPWRDSNPRMDATHGVVLRRPYQTW